MGTNIKKELLRFISEDIQSGDVTSVLLPKNKIKAEIISREIKNQKPIIIISGHYSNWEWLLVTICIFFSKNIYAIYKNSTLDRLKNHNKYNNN